jgi:hypothetical protein
VLESFRNLNFRIFNMGDALKIIPTFRQRDQRNQDGRDKLQYDDRQGCQVVGGRLVSFRNGI